jgi:hypothetical protein
MQLLYFGYWVEQRCHSAFVFSAKFYKFKLVYKYNKLFNCEYCLFYFSFQILLTVLNMNEISASEPYLKIW